MIYNQKMYPKISLITAVYNNERHIESAIKSASEQTYSNIEYIVIDGGSTDRTLDVINRHRDKIHQFVSEKDKGIYDALNKGINRATGDVIGFLHSDDLLESNTVIEKIASAFQTNEIDGVYSDLDYVTEGNNGFRIVRHWKSKPFTSSLLMAGWMPPHPTLFLKKSVYEKTGLFNLNYRISADYDFILRTFAQKEFKFHYLPQVNVKMRIGGESNRNLERIIKKSKEDYAILKSHGYSAIYSLLYKNLSKINQFFVRKRK
jgi:glycosyltransferase